MARRKKAEVGDVLELKGNVVIRYPDGSTVTGRRSFTPPMAGDYTVHDGNTGAVVAAYAVTAPEVDDVDQDDADQDDVDQDDVDQDDAGDQAAAADSETAGADEGQADASAAGDPAPADDQAGA